LRRLGRFDDAFAILDRLDDLSPDGLGLFEAHARYQRGNVHRAVGHIEEARRWFEAAVVSAQRTRSLSGRSYAEYGLAELARMEGRWADAAAHYQAAYDAQGRAGGQDDALDVARLAEAEVHLGHLDRSTRLLGEAEELARRSGVPRGWAIYHLVVGEVRRAQGRRDDARRHLQEVLTVGPRVHFSDGLRSALVQLAEMADEDGDSVTAEDYRAQAAAVPPR
jgi:tetratricopeptide (TPR) repeat protein